MHSNTTSPRNAGVTVPALQLAASMLPENECDEPMCAPSQLVSRSKATGCTSRILLHTTSMEGMEMGVRAGQCAPSAAACSAL